MSVLRTTALAAIAAALPIPAHATPLTFAAALDAARADAPSIAARTAAVAAARARAIAADRLPDPTLDLGLKDLPVTGRDAFTLNRDDFTMTTIGLSQQIPNLAKRHARAALASAGIGVAEAEAEVERRSVRLATALAWIDLYYAQRRLARLKTLDASLADLQRTVAARLTSGSARPSQTLEPEQLRAQVRDRRSAIIAAAATARARLTRYTGIADPEVAGPPPDPALHPERLVAAVRTLPALRARDAATRLAEAEVAVARADKRSDWTVSASYGRREPNYADLVSLGVSFDLPLFAKRRQNPRIAAAASEAERARLDRIAAEREVVAALESDLAEHDMHHDRLANARDRLVPLARRRADLDRDSYAAGQTDLGAALLAVLAASEAEVDLLDREAAVARDAVAISISYAEGDA